MMVEWDRDLERALADLKTRTAEITYSEQLLDIGTVQRVGDGVAVVEGLSQATLDETVLFANGVHGQVLDLDRDAVGCIIFGPDEGIAAGSRVVRTGQVITMPVGLGLLGRAVDALGQPRDGGPSVQSTERWAIEREAPGVLDREPVREPLLTGIKAIDGAIPIGRGQRELVLGDRSTGKTSLALDAIVNQRETGVICIYVSIGRKRARVKEIIDELRQCGASEHTVVVIADAADAVALRYIAPYAAASLAEWFAHQGRHVLIVYDDLTRHAEAYRDISLVLRRPPSREAYPGDIFYLHARLMERSYKLKTALGGGSVTALPILETQRGNIAAFIPTNLISMTDGQLFLDTELVMEGQLPAVDIGRSVSRVGGSAQPGAMREAAANLRLDLAQYDDVKGFARFGAILDPATQAQIERGKRLARVLVQPERRPMPLALQVAELWALKSGMLDQVDVDKIGAFEQALGDTASSFNQLREQLVSALTLSAQAKDELGRWIATALAATRDAS